MGFVLYYENAKHFVRHMVDLTHHLSSNHTRLKELWAVNIQLLISGKVGCHHQGNNYATKLPHCPMAAGCWWRTSGYILMWEYIQFSSFTDSILANSSTLNQEYALCIYTEDLGPKSVPLGGEPFSRWALMGGSKVIALEGIVGPKILPPIFASWLMTWAVLLHHTLCMMCYLTTGLKQ